MSRYAIFVDAGYLLAQAAHIMSGGKSKSRAGLSMIDSSGLIDSIKKEAAKHLDISNKELLRVYWYDGVNTKGPTLEQKTITRIPDVQFRGGTINAKGQQKGVDTLLVIDIIELSTNHAISDAIIIASDGDFAAGIELAQRRGVRIAVIGIEDDLTLLLHQQSADVRDRADRSGLANADLVKSYFSYIDPTVETENGLFFEIVKSFIAQHNPSQDAISKPDYRIDSEIDRLLIHAAYMNVGNRLSSEEKINLRKEFIAQMSASLDTQRPT